MSSNPTPPGAVSHDSTTKGVLNALASVNGEVALALQIGEVALPFVKGAIKEVKSVFAGGVETIEYTVAVSTGQANLDHAMSVDDQIIADVNSELVRQGVAPLKTP